MSLELRFFHDLVLRLPGRSNQVAPEDLELLKEDFKQISSHTRAAGDRLMQRFYASADKEERTMLVHDFEKGIVFLCDCLKDHMDSNDIDHIYSIGGDFSLPDLYKRIFTASEEMLHMLAGYFKEHFNEQQKMSEIKRLITATEIKEKMEHIRLRLEVAEVDVALVDILLHPFSQFVNGGKPEAASFRRYFALTELEQSIPYEALMDEKASDPTRQLMEWLHDWNFNSAAFHKFCIGEWQTELDECPNLQVRMGVLRKMIKQRREAAPERTELFHPANPGTQKLALDWLKAEKEDLQELMDEQPEAEEAREMEKFLTGMSIAQLACFTRLMVDTGTFVTPQHNKLFEFFSRSFSTKQRQDISYETFRTKFYRVDPGTMNAVRDLLIKMINRSREEEFALATT
jgi:HSP20 family molecular chaperone IbpA